MKNSLFALAVVVQTGAIAYAATAHPTKPVRLHVTPNPVADGGRIRVRVRTRPGVLCVGTIWYPHALAGEPRLGSANRHGRIAWTFAIHTRYRRARVLAGCVVHGRRPTVGVRVRILHPAGTRREAGTAATAAISPASAAAHTLASAERTTLANPFTFEESSRQFLSSPGSLTTFTFERFHGYYAKTLPGVESERGHTTTATYGRETRRRWHRG